MKQHSKTEKSKLWPVKIKSLNPDLSQCFNVGLLSVSNKEIALLASLSFSSQLMRLLFINFLWTTLLQPQQKKETQRCWDCEVTEESK